MIPVFAHNVRAEHISQKLNDKEFEELGNPTEFPVSEESIRLIYAKCQEMLAGTFTEHEVCVLRDEVKRQAFCLLIEMLARSTADAETGVLHNSISQERR